MKLSMTFMLVVGFGITGAVGQDYGSGAPRGYYNNGYGPQQAQNWPRRGRGGVREGVGEKGGRGTVQWEGTRGRTRRRRPSSSPSSPLSHPSSLRRRQTRPH